jgi:hypothetical protein
MQYCYLICNGRTTLKLIPIQPWTGPEDSRKSRLPEFLDNRHRKVARLSVLRSGRLYLPGDTPGTHFCYGLSRRHDHSAAGKIKSTENPGYRIKKQTSDLPACISASIKCAIALIDISCIRAQFKFVRLENANCAKWQAKSDNEVQPHYHESRNETLDRKVIVVHVGIRYWTGKSLLSMSISDTGLDTVVNVGMRHWTVKPLLSMSELDNELESHCCPCRNETTESHYCPFRNETLDWTVTVVNVEMRHWTVKSLLSILELDTGLEIHCCQCQNDTAD